MTTETPTTRHEDHPVRQPGLGVVSDGSLRATEGRWLYRNAQLVATVSDETLPCAARDSSTAPLVQRPLEPGDGVQVAMGYRFWALGCP